MLRMYPLQQAATDYLKKVADMRSVLTPITRKRATVDGTTYPVTMAYSLFSYETGNTPCSVPFVHTPDGIRFYEPVTLGGVSVSQLAFDADSQELRSADGRFVLPKPTTIEQSFVAPQTQWLFSYKASSGTPSDMCDELLSIVTACADVINNGSWGEKVRELYLGANMESFASDRHRWVLGWHTRLSGAIDFYVGYAVDMNVVDAGVAAEGLSELKHSRFVVFLQSAKYRVALSLKPHKINASNRAAVAPYLVDGGKRFFHNHFVAVRSGEPVGDHGTSFRRVDRGDLTAGLFYIRGAEGGNHVGVSAPRRAEYKFAKPRLRVGRFVTPGASGTVRAQILADRIFERHKRVGYEPVLARALDFLSPRKFLSLSLHIALSAENQNVHILFLSKIRFPRRHYYIG